MNFLFEAVNPLIFAVGCLAAHWPSNWFVRKIIRRWKPKGNDPEDRLGAFIGTLERILILTFIQMNALTAIGLVITMKSIARYDKLQQDKTFAEYFLAGTMLSTLIALLLGIVAKNAVKSILLLK